MNNLIVMPLTRKKWIFKNIYCSSCNVWVAEYYLSCHLNSVGHEQKIKKSDICEKACKNKSTA